VNGDCTRYVRTNQSYRDFFMRFFGLDPSAIGPDFVKYDAPFLKNVVKICCEQGIRTFYDEKMPDGSIVHSFARPIDKNPVTGITAVAIAVLSIREPGERLLAEQILSVIEQFGEYIPGGFFIYKADKDEELLYANKAVFDIFGCDGLEEFKALTGFTFRGMVHPEDYNSIFSSIEEQIQESEADLDFVEYRIIRKDGDIRWIEDYGHYIEYDDQNSLYYVFISDITEKHEQAESDKALHSAVIEALTKAYDSVWLINDIETQKFELFRIDKEMEHLMPANIAAKLEKFTQALAFYSKLVFEEDRQFFLEATSSENIVRNTESKLIYAVPFRRVFEKDIRHYKVEFTRLNLPGGKTGIVAGFKNVDDEVQREQTIQHSINQRDAIIEALTRTYDSAFLITDIKEERFELYRVDENTVHFIPSQEAAKIKKFSNAFLNYSKLVMKEDRDQFLSAVTPENIIENTSNKLIYSVPFRRVFENGVRYYNVEFSKIDLGNGDVNYIAGFKDVDEVRNGKQLD